MFKELLKYMVIGVVAGIASYLVISDTPVSIKVDQTSKKVDQTSNENNVSVKNSYNYIYEAVKDSVVTIQTDKGRGSGVIVTSEGHIVTNEHVIRQAQIVNIITTDNKIYPAKIVGVDSITDIALLHSSYEGKSITFSDSTLVKIGDIVLAIGNPFGVGQTLTQGIISRTNSGHITENPLDEFLQSDAAINPGNSGGAMINTDGNLVGINTMNLSLGGGSDGIGLAVPSNLVRNIIEQIIKYGSVVRGYVGMSAYSTPSGVVISNVLKDGPADKSGLTPGDIIVSIDGITIKNIKQVVKIVASLEVNQKVIIKYRRDKELVESSIKVTAMPKSHKSISR
jgi:S1-C subfamily serine protease